MPCMFALDFSISCSTAIPPRPVAIGTKFFIFNASVPNAFKPSELPNIFFAEEPPEATSVIGLTN